jgi:Flp pilus assembly secretin CpaC
MPLTKWSTPDFEMFFKSPRIVTDAMVRRNRPGERSVRCCFRAIAVTVSSACVAAVIGGLLSDAARAQPVSVRAGAVDASLENGIAAALRMGPSKRYEFNRAPLRDVLRFLADDAGISFVSLPDVGLDESVTVTFTLEASPFRALEVIAKANGVALFFEGGVWYLRPYNDQELVGRTYKLQYNPQEVIEYQGGGSYSETSGSAPVGGTSAGTAAVPDLGLSLQASPDVFKVGPNPLIKDIKQLLGLPTDGFEANIAPEATVDSVTPLGTSPSRVQARAPAGPAGGESGAQVIWNSDSNTLYVVATRQQHQWIEGYLASVDRPQNLIAIEVKFFETTKDPRKQLGVDWSGTLGEGFSVAARNIVAAPNGSFNVFQSSDHLIQEGDLPPGQLPFDFTQREKATTATFAAPYSAVLTASNVEATVRAFLNDRDTSTVSYPRVLTVNNREVVIRSVVNRPVLASTSTVTPGVGGTTTATIAYLPIGTIINILPKVISDGSVMLNVSVTVSSIIGDEPIEGNNYPVTTSRVYNAALQVNSGLTLAIGGIDEAFDSTRRNGIPLLKDIPLLGAAFRSDERQRNRKNLILFITPTTLPRGTAVGIPEKPESVVQVMPDDPMPPTISPNGELIGGIIVLDNAVRWVERRQEFYHQVVKEHRTDRKTLEEIQGLQSTCVLLLAQIEAFRVTHPSQTVRLDAAQMGVDGVVIGLTELMVKAKEDILKF